MQNFEINLLNKLLFFIIHVLNVIIKNNAAINCDKNKNKNKNKNQFISTK